MVSDSVLEKQPHGKGGGTGTGTGNGNGNETGHGGGRDAEAESASPTTGPVESLQKLALTPALERLQSICIVLGVDYNKKLLEMGVTSEEDLKLSRVQTHIDDLIITVEANYKKIKDIGKELLAEWELSETPFKRMMKFAHIISVSDSTSSSNVTDGSFLSTLWLKRAQKELDSLRAERGKKVKKEYEKQKSKLKEMVAENHITWESVGFDPKRKANPEKYIEETVEIQKSISKAKVLASGRKELVFIVELVRQLIDQNKLPLHTIVAF